jgi:hypothetical protein
MQPPAVDRHRDATGSGAVTGTRLIPRPREVCMGHGAIDIHGMDGRMDAIRLEQMLNLPARRAMIGQAGRLPGVRSCSSAHCGRRMASRRLRTGTICHVLREDVYLAEAIPAPVRARAIEECIATVVRIPRGAWAGHRTNSLPDGIGLLVLEGLLIRARRRRR